VTATNVGYTGTIAAGGTVTVGFQATHTGTTAFTLNNDPCVLA
jgi:hypothetical protein